MEPDDWPNSTEILNECVRKSYHVQVVNHEYTNHTYMLKYRYSPNINFPNKAKSLFLCTIALISGDMASKGNV